MRDLGDLKKLLLLFSTSLIYSNGLSDILSHNQNELLDTQKSKIEIEASKLKNSWINPIVIQYSKSYSTQFNKTIGSGQFIISVNQPIFKMGGIWEAIKYAKAMGRANSLDLELKRQELISRALNILFNIKKLTLQIDKLNLLIENDELDILIQKESYEAGLSNRTLYDRALIKRNQDITSKLELEMSLAELRSSFSLLSDKSPDTIELPNFIMIDRNRYENNQLEIKRDTLHIKEKRHYKFMTLTKYLPEVSITGRYVNEDRNPLFANAQIKKEYYTYGFKITMPININSYRDIETSKIDYLNAKIELDEQRKRVANEYNLIKERIDIIKKKIELSNRDAKNYASMLITAKDRQKVGDSTTYDTQIVQNSLNIREIDSSIYRYDIQLELLKLYSKISNINLKESF